MISRSRDRESPVKIKYSQGHIETDEVVKFLSLAGQAEPVLKGIILGKEAAKKAAGLKIEASDEEVQAFADHWRLARSLFTARDTLDHFKRNGLTVDEFSDFCEQAVLMRKLKDHLASESRVREHFLHHRAEFDRARISTMTVRDKNLAEEIVVQVAEEKADFHVLARRFSQDENLKDAGGYLGFVARGRFRSDIAARIFNAAPGSILGPFREEGAWLVILVEDVVKAALTEKTRDLIKDRIFEEWVASFLKTAPTVAR